MDILWNCQYSVKEEKLFFQSTRETVLKIKEIFSSIICLIVVLITTEYFINSYERKKEQITSFRTLQISH